MANGREMFDWKQQSYSWKENNFIVSFDESSTMWGVNITEAESGIGIKIGR